MNYAVILSDGTSIVVTQEQGEKLKQLKLDESPTLPVDVNGNVYELSRIKMVRKANETISDQHPDYSNRCVGKKSIQAEIMFEIYRDNPKTWREKVGDKRLREDIRKRLWTESDDWCDSVAGTCVCKLHKVKAHPLETMRFWNELGKET